MKHLLQFKRPKFISENAAHLLVFVFTITTVFTSCKKDSFPPCNDGMHGKNKKAGIVVHRGGSIQAAVDAAAPGSTIMIEPGIYKGEITITKSGIQLIGMDCSVNEKVVIKNSGDEDCGIMVHKGGDGFVLKNVTVEGFSENGVYLEFIDHFLLSNITAIDCEEYGLYPVHCTNGVIEYCTASGSADTGIYVGQSENVVMQYNTAFANVNGLEVENCTNVIVLKNHSYDNVAGILIILLPGLPVKTASGVEVKENNFENNNHVNFGDPSEGFESLVPSGTGILNVGVDNVTIQNNKISNNNFTGIATVSDLVLGALAGLPPEAFSDIEPNPDNSKIIDNILVNNGTKPPTGLPLPGVDLLWDGSGNSNCWQNNKYSSSYP
ncbi:MAG: parallel beta-helix domain-containing protein, partial [Ginsengibacter sp.]